MKVRISNRLYIEQPTSAVKAYCQKNLVLDNPDYYKAEKQGRWTGNIPRKIMLYEIHGVDYWLPFGCLQDVWRIHPYKSDYINEISPIAGTAILIKSSWQSGQKGPISDN